MPMSSNGVVSVSRSGGSCSAVQTIFRISSVWAAAGSVMAPILAPPAVAGRGAGHLAARSPRHRARRGPPEGAQRQVVARGHGPPNGRLDAFVPGAADDHGHAFPE